jgi:hypothetical protein
VAAVTVAHLEQLVVLVAGQAAGLLAARVLELLAKETTVALPIIAPHIMVQVAAALVLSVQMAEVLGLLRVAQERLHLLVVRL